MTGRRAADQRDGLAVCIRGDRNRSGAVGHRWRLGCCGARNVAARLGQTLAERSQCDLTATLDVLRIVQARHGGGAAGAAAAGVDIVLGGGCGRRARHGDLRERMVGRLALDGANA